MRIFLHFSKTTTKHHPIQRTTRCKILRTHLAAAKKIKWTRVLRVFKERRHELVARFSQFAYADSELGHIALKSQLNTYNKQVQLYHRLNGRKKKKKKKIIQEIQSGYIINVRFQH